MATMTTGIEERPVYIQDDLKFIPPPGGATGLNDLTATVYTPQKGRITILSEKGAEPHYVEGANIQLRIGRKPAGRHQIALLTAAEPFLVRYGKEEMVLDSGVYYVVRVDNGTNPPLVA